MDNKMFELINVMQKEQAELYNQHSKKLNELLIDYCPVKSAIFFSSLLLNPTYQSTTATLEKAIHMCLGVCSGNELPTSSFLENVFQSISENGFGIMEDPAEDVFASRLWLNGKDYRVLLGLWEGCLLQTQIFLNVLESMPKEGAYLSLLEKITAILEASDIVIDNFDLPINTVTSDTPLRKIEQKDLGNISTFTEWLDISMVKNAHKLPVLQADKWKALSTAVLGTSDLEEAPFINAGEKYYLILPTAITTSIRRLIFSFCQREGQSKSLVKGLARATSNFIYELRVLGEYKNAPAIFERNKETDNWLIARSSIEFDIGHHYHFIFLMDTLEGFEHEWFHGFLGVDDGLSKLISDAINQFDNEILLDDPKAKTCTIIVSCGFGRGFSIPINANIKNQMLEFISLDDLKTLSEDYDCNPQRIWRLIEAQSLAEKFNAQISNPNGFLNLYGYIKRNDFSLINHSDFANVDFETVTLSIGTNFQAGIREKVLQDNDTKNVMHPESGVIRIQRAFPNSLFKQNDAYNIYYPVTLSPRLLQAVLSEKNENVWVEMALANREHLSLQIQIFKAFISWLPKTVSALRKVGFEILPIQLIRIELDFPSNSRWEIEKPTEELVLDSCEYYLDDFTLDCQFDSNLIRGISLPTNCAEKALLKPLITKVCRNDGIAIQKVIAEVFENPYARHVHSFPSTGYSENIVENFESEKPISLEIAADNNIRFGLGWLNGKRPESASIEGKVDCKKYLGAVVGQVWEKAKGILSKLDKSQLIELLLSNIELADLHRMRWNRTLKANLHLHEDEEDVIRVATKEVGLLTQTTLASRLIIEMAICECSENGGKTPGVMDIQELESYAISLHLLGGVSEAINYDSIPPKLEISFFGDILYDHDFEDLIVQRYQSGLHKDKFNNAVKYYDGLHSLKEKKVSAEEVEESFDDDFWDAWYAEFRFTPNQGIDFIRALQDLGMNKNELVFSMSTQDLLSLPAGLEEDVLFAIMDCLSLKSRDSWTEIPQPYKKSDWQPWKFGRRYSISFKPLIYLEESDNYIVSPEQIKRGFFHLLRCAYEATIDENHFFSKKMVSWNGHKKAKTGLEFNTTVANTLDSSMWHTEEEVKLTKVLNKKLSDFGDIDVLAWHKSKNLVLAIECKDLEVAKNQSEIARQLYEFKGQVNSKGKSDRLHKHIKRIGLLNDDLEGVRRYTRKSGDLRVVGLVVFSSIVPMHFLDNQNHGIIFTSYDQLPVLLTQW